MQETAKALSIHDPSLEGILLAKCNACQNFQAEYRVSACSIQLTCNMLPHSVRVDRKLIPQDQTSDTIPIKIQEKFRGNFFVSYFLSEDKL